MLPSCYAQMRRHRKGRAHALVMGGDATPISGPVTVRIYCGATQQRLQVNLLPNPCPKLSLGTRFSYALRFGLLLCDIPLPAPAGRSAALLLLSAHLHRPVLVITWQGTDLH